MTPAADVRSKALLALAVAAMAACYTGRDGAPPPEPVAPSPRIATIDAAATEAPPASVHDEPKKALPEARCPASPWPFYGHDAARTSSTDGCVQGPVAITWRFTRSGLCGYKFRPGRVVNVVGDENALFAGVSCGGAPAVMRISPSGEPGWTFSRSDFGRGTWPALVGDAILSTDDGVFLVDRETGKYHGKELDVWGEPLAFGDWFYVDNTFQLDSAGPFVAAFDRSLKWIWRANEIGVGKGHAVPRTGGVAAADGLVVHAAARGGRGIPSLSTHDARTGERRWLAKDVWPASAASIADGRVFTIEQWIGEKQNRLVARSLANGDVAWSASLPWARGPAPVIGGRFVLVHLAEEVRAFDRSNGAVAWARAVPRAASFEEHATTMAVAMGSRTVVVTSGPRLVILGLEDGKEQWSSAIVSGSSVTQIGGITIERPIVIGRSVYVVSDGTLLRLDPTKRAE